MALAYQYVGISGIRALPPRSQDEVLVGHGRSECAGRIPGPGHAVENIEGRLPVPVSVPCPEGRVAMLVDHIVKRVLGHAQPCQELSQIARRAHGVVACQVDALFPRHAAQPDFPAGVIGDLAVAVLEVLDKVVDVGIVPAVNVMIGVERAALLRRFVPEVSDHPLVLSARVPAEIVVEVDAAHADPFELPVVGISILGDVRFGDPVELADQVLGFEAHQVVFLAVLAGHLDFIKMAEHADLIYPLMRPPDDQRDLELDGDLDWEDGLPGKAMPIDAVQPAQRGARDALDRFRTDGQRHDVAVEANAQVDQVADADVGVVMLVVRHEQRIHAVDVLENMDDKVRVPGAADRDYAVIVVAGAIPVGIKNPPQPVGTLTPVKGILLLMNPAAATYTRIIKCDVERMMRAIEATGTEAHHMTSFSIMMKRMFSSSWSLRLSRRPASSKQASA